MLIAGLAIMSTWATAGCVEEESAPYADYGHDDGPWATWCGDPGREVCITWLTAHRAPTRLQLGSSPETLEVVHDDAKTSYLHKVRLEDLEPDSLYYYQPDQTLSGDDVAAPFRFRTAPVVARPLRFAVVGDMQPDEPRLLASNMLVADALREQDVDFVVQLGDAVQQGYDLDLWHMLLTSLPRVAGYHTLLGVIGNHDRYGEGGRNWETLFPYPVQEPRRARYYAVALPGVRLLMLDNYEDDDWMTEPQLTWLEDELSAATAAGEWALVFMHSSILSTGTSNMKFDLQRALVPIFDKHGVAAVFYGHDHMYEHWVYTYGASGLVHDPAHTWPHRPVHYFESGGGGAALEDFYGLTTRAPELETRTWYDVNRGDWLDVPTEVRPWNPARVVDWADPAYSPDGAAYYHDAAVEAYQSDVEVYGHEYGETALHFLTVEVDGARCVIRAVYPDGTLLSGPGRGHPQEWILER